MRDAIDASDDSLSVESLERIDRVCLDFEAAWREGGRPSIEQSVRGTEGVERARLLWELLVLEIDYRSRRNEEFNSAEYRLRFPGDEGAVKEAFAQLQTADSPGQTPLDRAAARSRTPPLGRFADYELLDVLGEGGMGIVYRARQPGANRIVALKVIRPDRLAAVLPESRQQALQRFRTEARTAAHLEHDHIVTVYEVGETDGQPYYSMRYVDGESLYDRLRRGPLEGRRAAELLEPIARAVHCAHQAGVLHRDLKPRNILLDAEDRPYVTDFGLAKWFQEAPDLTRTGGFLGTLPYSSPEQARTESLAQASDVYSLGATLYEMLTARPPFRAATTAQTLRQISESEPVAPRQLNAAVPRDLETICLKCLEKSPARRYATAEEMAEDLRRFLRREPIRARRASLPARAGKWCHRNPWMATALALVLVVAVAAPVAAVVQYRLAKANADLADERQGLIDELGRTITQVEGLYQTTSTQKERLRHALLNSDLMRVSDLMKVPNLKLARRILLRHVPQPGETDHRSFVWHYWWRECHREERSIVLPIIGHTAAISRDGKLLAAQGRDRRLMLVDLETYRPIPLRYEPKTIIAGMRGLSAAVFLSNREVLTVSLPMLGKSIVIRWRIERNGQECVLHVEESATLNARAVLSGYDLNDSPAAALDPHGELVAAVVSTREQQGGRLVLGQKVAIWCARSGTLIDTIELDATPPVSMSPSALAIAGVWLVVGDTVGRIQVWRRGEDGAFAAGDRLRDIDDSGYSYQDRVTSIAFEPPRAERFAAVDQRGGIVLFDPNSGAATTVQLPEAPLSPVSSRNAVNAVALLPEGNLAMANEDGTVALRHVRADPHHPPSTVYRDESSVKWVGYSRACSAVVSLDGEHVLKRWPLPDAERSTEFPGVAISPDFQTVLARPSGPLVQRGATGSIVVKSDPRLQLVDVATGKARGEAFGDWQVMPRRTWFLPGSRVLVFNVQRPSLDVWNAETGELVSRHEGSKRSGLRVLAVDGQGERVAIGTRKGITILRADTWEEVAAIPVQGATGTCFFNAGDEILIANRSGALRWTLSTPPKQVEQLTLPPEHGRMWCSPDCRLAAIVLKQHVLQLWDLKADTAVQTFEGHSDGVLSFAFNPDGKTAASGSQDGTIKVWDLATGEERLSLRTGATDFLGFSPSGRVLAARGARGSIRLWYADDGANSGRDSAD